MQFPPPPAYVMLQQDYYQLEEILISLRDMSGVRMASTPVPELRKPPTIVVVDDIFNSGKTIAAIME